MAVAVPLDRVGRVVDHWVGERPRLHPERCTTARHDRAECRACQDVCRAGALRVDPVRRVVEIEAEACTGCDACVAACPTGALASRAPRPSSRSLACPAASGAVPGSQVVACVGGMGAGALIELLAGGDVTLVVADCATCERGSGGAVAARVEAVNRTLGALGWPHRVSLQVVADTPPPPEAPVEVAPTRARRRGPEVSRRGFFRFAGIGLRDTAGAALAEPPRREIMAWADPGRDGRPTPVGSALVDLAFAAAAPAATEIHVTALALATPTVGPDCELCGACAAFCPTGALRLSPDAGSAVLDVDVSACAGCGLCAAICPTAAVALSDIVSVGDLQSGRRPLRRGSPPPTGPRGPMTTAAAFAAHLPAAGSRPEGAVP